MNKIELFEHALPKTPIQPLSGRYADNSIYVKRDDLIPFSFGGNKARKAAEFYKEISGTDTDVIMTYGSNSSNHCRIIANMAASMGLRCHVISPNEHREVLYNTKLVEQFGAVIETCPVDRVAETIERRKEAYREEGFRPYFITGGGHGNPGTESYVKAYREICRQEAEMGVRFDYIFHASGTGATQAGLVCGQLLEAEEIRNRSDKENEGEDCCRKAQAATDRKIVGISIARVLAGGRNVVRESIRDYLGERFDALYEDDKLIFTDAYRKGGYAEYDEQITETIRTVMEREGIPMDTTYVGKAFSGMIQYLQEQGIRDKRILFIHTGGAPLFFDKL